MITTEAKSPFRMRMVTLGKKREESIKIGDDEDEGNEEGEDKE